MAEAVSCRSFDDVVNFAIKKAENGREFYNCCHNHAKNPAIKEFFKELLDRQDEHLKILHDLDPYGLEDFKLDHVEDLKISDYLVDTKFSEDITYQEALTLAMKREQKAHEFYANWQDKCAHEKTTRVFELLAKDKLKSKRELENRYDDEILEWD